MNILAIDTSCDETSAAVVCGRKVLSSVVYSQMVTHKQWGGVVPSIAKRAHIERIDGVIDEALQKSKLSAPKTRAQMLEKIDVIAVTYGPGLAIALEVGIAKAHELAKTFQKPLIPINHMEGHIYSCFAQNRAGNPQRPFAFPYLALLVSGGHTELIFMKDHLQYTILGETLDDAAGESLDKAARMLGFGYPGGPIIERLARSVQNQDLYKFPRPMWKTDDLNLSFSGLKTSFLYFTKSISEEERVAKINQLASSFQEAVFQSILKKTEKAITQTGVSKLLLGGGVGVNTRLRWLLRTLVKKHNGHLFPPPLKYLNFDNAAMIGIAAAVRAERGMFLEQGKTIDRVPRLSLLQSSI